MILLNAQDLTETGLTKNVGYKIVHTYEADSFFATLLHDHQNPQSGRGNVIQGMAVNLHFSDDIGCTTSAPMILPNLSADTFTPLQTPIVGLIYNKIITENSSG